MGTFFIALVANLQIIKIELKWSWRQATPITLSQLHPSFGMPALLYFAAVILPLTAARLGDLDNGVTVQAWTCDKTKTQGQQWLASRAAIHCDNNFIILTS